MTRAEAIEITASGIKTVEYDERESPKPMISPTYLTINSVSASSGVQIGDHNTQSFVTAMELLIQKIDAVEGSDEEKKQAKSALLRALEHPLISSILGSAVTSLFGLLK